MRSGFFDTSDSCYSITRIAGYTVGSVDCILRFLYSSLMTSMHFRKNTGYMADHVLQLITLVETHVDESCSDPARRFKLECYGHEPTKTEVMQQRWNEKVFRYRPREANTIASMK